MTQSLRRFLLGKYGGSSDRRITNPNTNGPIGIDDRRNSDAPSECCWIFVTFPQPEGETFDLCLSQSPYDQRVKDWATKRKAQLTSHPRHPDRVQIDARLDASDVRSIRSLAGRINAIPKRKGKRTATNPHRNYPWLCERTAASLYRFAEFLEEYHVQKALPPDPEQLEGLFAILAEMPKAASRQMALQAQAPKQQRTVDKSGQRCPDANAGSRSRPAPDEQDDLFNILADWDRDVAPVKRVVGEETVTYPNATRNGAHPGPPRP
jgi:hypothetical protein